MAKTRFTSEGFKKRLTSLPATSAGWTDWSRPRTGWRTRSRWAPAWKAEAWVPPAEAQFLHLPPRSVNRTSWIPSGIQTGQDSSGESNRWSCRRTPPTDSARRPNASAAAGQTPTVKTPGFTRRCPSPHSSLHLNACEPSSV
jgi:hypothetical protein